MLIIRKNQINNLVATASQNRTLNNPYYLFSFQHILSRERVSFFPEVMSSNTRYDQFRFVESPIDDLTVMPPLVTFPYLGQYYYSIYECYTSGNTDPSFAYNQLESGRAVVIVGNDTEYDCLYEQFVSDNEENANIIFISEKEEECIDTSPTPTPSFTPTMTPTPTCPVTTQYLEVELQDNTKFKLTLWNDSGFSSPASALCDYTVSGTAYGDMGTVYTGTEDILTGQHNKQFDLAPILQPGEIITGFTVYGTTTTGCTCPVNVIFSTTPVTPTPTPTLTPTPSSTTPSNLLTFNATFGQSAYEACNVGTPVTIYAEDLGNCGPCLPGPCWACLTTLQQVFTNSSLTTIVPNGYYAVNGGVWEIVGGYPQPGGFFGCPPNPTPSPTAIAHSYSWTGYTSQVSSCDAYTGQTTTVTLYGNLPDIDNNSVLFDSASGQNTTNLFGSYSMWNGSTWVCFNLDSYGVVYPFFSVCSFIC